MSLFQRQLNKCGKDIILMDRAVGVDGVDLDESFVDKPSVKALIKTVRGKTVFDGSNIEREVTHLIRILFLADITAETWVKFNDVNLDILDIINCKEDDKVLILRCNERGHNSLPVNDA